MNCELLRVIKLCQHNAVKKFNLKQNQESDLRRQCENTF